MKLFELLGEFGWKYLRPYRSRLAFGLFCGLCYAGVNVLMVLSIQLVTECVLPPKPATEEVRPADSTPAPSEKATPPRHFLVEQTVVLVEQTVAWADVAKEQAKSTIKQVLPVLGRENTWWQIAAGLLFLPSLVLFRAVFDFGNGYSMKWVSERFINDLRFGILVKLQSLSLDYFNKSKTSDLLERIGVDSKVLYTSIQLLLAETSKEAINLLALLTVLLVLDTKLTLMVAIGMPLTLLPTIILGRKVKKAKKLFRKAMVGQGGVILESIANIRVVKAFRLEQQQQAEFRSHARSAIKNNMRTHRAEQLISPLMDIFFALGVSAVIFYIISTATTVPEFARFIAALGLTYGSIKKLGIAHLRIQAAHASLTRLQQTMDSLPSVRERAGARQVQGLGQSLRFENVTFGFGDQPVLRNISFEIRRGERIGLAGPSGCGKSTLINLLLRFYDPEQGKILWDGTDLRELQIDSLRAQTSFVSQEILLFDKSIADNIAVGREGATRDEVIEAARMAGAHDFVTRLPDGYDSLIGERGSRLSGGQRQRISIARAFVRHAPLILLDEPTAALDSASEREVQEGLEKLPQGSTIVCVAHRLSTLMNYDRILVLDEGRLVEQGAFKELIERNGLFATMARSQGLG